MDIKVLGSGCASCRETTAIIENVLKGRALGVAVEKVNDMRDIAGYGVMATPAVVIDGVVVHAGGVPTAERVGQWLDKVAKPACCADSTCCT